MKEYKERDILKIPYWTRRRKVLLATAVFYFVLGVIVGGALFYG